MHPVTCIERAASSAAGTPGGMGPPSASPPFDSGSPIAARLSRLVRPRSVAVVGGREAGRVVEQCDRMGFAGALWPVHPERATVAGRPAFRSVSALPAPPDAAFVGVNRHATVEVVAALSHMGAGGAVCYASGFLEAGDGGALQRALVEVAGEMPIIGPNCYGLINFLDGAPLWPDQHGGRRLGADGRGVAIVTQSSNIAISMTMQRRALPIAYVVTAGNQAQLGVSRLASAFLEDGRVSALGLHVEGFDSVAGFEALAREARARSVPVVVMKAGRSERGRAATLSHTASVAGSDAGAEAFLRRLGFARVHGVPEFLEALKLLHVHGALDGPRLGAMCCSGGEAGLLADSAEGTGVALPDLAPEHAAAVGATVHPLVTVANPLDYHTFSWGDEAALAGTFTAFARAGFDATLLVLDFPRPDRCEDADWWVAADAFGRAMRAAGAKGVVAATLGENLPEETAERLMERGIAPLGGVREAFAAIECAAAVGEAWRAPPGAPLLADGCPPGSSHDDPQGRHQPGAPLRAGECLPGSSHDDPQGRYQPSAPFLAGGCLPGSSHSDSQGRHQPGAPLRAGERLPDALALLDEAASKARLAAFGVAIPPGAVARSEDEAVAVAASLGGPVAVKALGIAHKTERGAVRLGLSEPEKIREAARELLALGRGGDRSDADGSSDGGSGESGGSGSGGDDNDGAVGRLWHRRPRPHSSSGNDGSGSGGDGVLVETERGAVRPGPCDPGEAREAAEGLPAPGVGDGSGSDGESGDGGGVTGDSGKRVLVERFTPDIVAELIVGLHRDPQLGLLLTVGSGGTFVELAADSATLLLPVSEAEVRAALSGLRCAPVLEGYRGRTPADVDAAVAAILGIARFAVEHRDRLEELDVNPLGVRARGRGAVALDALIRMGKAAS